MTETTNDPRVWWEERVRKPGRVSAAALSVIPSSEIDVRRGRPPAPERLSAEERQLWEKLTFSRRPGWFSGAEAILESYVTTITLVQQIEGALRENQVGTPSYFKLMRQHRQSAMLAALLATKLRLTPSTRLDKTYSQDGELPINTT